MTMATAMATKIEILIQLELPNSLSRPPLGMMAPVLAEDRAAVRSELGAPQPEASILGILAIRRFTRYIPIQLNMMEVMTSFTLKKALNRPGNTPQMAPPTAAASRQTHQGIWNWMANSSAKKLPMVYWPEAPMLNRPVLKAKPTERPQSISGAA